MFRLILRRSFSTKKKPKASEIRQSFLDFFIKENDHTFIKSSSIIPHDDPTVAFVNAGMNQFKSILLGVQSPAVPRAANSQKCIRVGGKHNDLETVGKDGTHHTFFEMLGSWSFGDYFKERACSMAWQYMTETLRLEPKDLVVTYFAGDEREGLEPDKETASIWRNLSVTGERLVPGSMRDNFWEMGPIGPCGPCTEIHIKLPHGLMEIWNLVFIEYERKADGSLSRLSRKHVDTGMGLERLCSVVQNVPTTFDTDLFTPLFSCISKVSKAGQYGGSFDSSSEMDRGYRVLADHSRAVSVALADGMFPDQNHKLRRLLRRCLQISGQVFKQPGPHLTSELVRTVTESLGDFYPELQSSLSRSLAIVAGESEAYDAARKSASAEWRRMVQEKPELSELPEDLPGLPTAVAELKGKSGISGDLAFKFYDTYGLDMDIISTIAQQLRLEVDFTGMQRCIEHQQESSRVALATTQKLLQQAGVPSTQDNLKYDPPARLPCRVLALLGAHDELLESSTNKCRVVVDRTCMYAEAGGQVGDRGEIVSDTGRATVESVQKVGPYIIHQVRITEGKLLPNSPCEIILDQTLRLGCMQHHTATHLLNSALHQLLPDTYQRSSHVTPQHLTFDFASKDKLDLSQIQFIESYINDIIKSELEVERISMSRSELPSNATLIPGEHYPEEVFVLQVKDISIEPCCGTHCTNTRDVVDFCIVTEKSSGFGVRSLRALAGSSAVQARSTAVKFSQELTGLENAVNGDMKQLAVKVQEFKSKLVTTEIPFLERQDLLARLVLLDKTVTDTLRLQSKTQVTAELKARLATCEERFLVHVFHSDSPEPVNLAKANSLCLPDKASLIIVCDSNDVVRARCQVPEQLLREDFTAELWLQKVMSHLGTSGSSPKGQDPKLVFGMKPKKLQHNFPLLKAAVREAEEFARKGSRVS